MGAFKGFDILTGQLVENPRAGWICARISPTADCVALADLYARLASHVCDETDYMLAIEHHVRHMAVARFDRDDVLAGCAMIDATQSAKGGV